MLLPLLVAVLAVVALALAYRVYVLERRWRGVRYCWHAMKDVAAGKVFEGGEEFDHAWRDVVVEQLTMMRRFGVPPLTYEGEQQYEEQLTARGIRPLRRHIRKPD